MTEVNEAPTVTEVVRRTNPLYQRIASLAQAVRNCREAGNAEWGANHTARLDELVKNHMPSGSGIDNGVKFDLDASTPDKLVFHTAYHHMNDVGMYDGWTEHKVVVRPSFDDEIDVQITGRDRNRIKDYLCETFYYALTQEVEVR